MIHSLKKKSHRILTISLVAILVFILISNIAATIILHSIFARSDYNPAKDPQYTVSDYQDYPRREFSFKSGDNTLFGYVYETPAPKGNLILVHGMGSYGDRYLNITKYFVDHDWNVITFDMTGAGKSEGSYTKGLVQIKLDLKAVIEYVEKDESINNLPIVLWGHSMGGYAVATVVEDKPEVKGVVSISAFNRPNKIMTEHAKNYVGVLSNISYPFLWFNNFCVFGAEADKDASEIISNTSVPMLIIHGNNDTTVPLELSIYAQKESVNNPAIEFVLFEDNYHNKHSNIWLTVNAQSPDSSNPFKVETTIMDSMENFLSKTIE